MAIQPPDSLQQNIDGAEIGKEVIGVNVQTLFERLRSDDKNSTILPELGRKSLLYCLVEQPAVFWRNTSSETLCSSVSKALMLATSGRRRFTSRSFLEPINFFTIYPIMIASTTTRRYGNRGRASKRLA